MPPAGKEPANGERLRALVRQQLERVSRDAIERGELTGQDLDTLEKLSDLDARLPEPPAHPARRWPVALLVLGLFLIPGLMISFKVPTVEIQLSLLVTEVSWRQAETGDVIGRVALTSLSAGSFDTVSLPRTRDAGEQVLTGPPVNFSVPPGGAGRISLAGAQAAEGARVWVSDAGTGTTAGLALRGDTAEVTVNLGGPVEVVSRDAGPVTRDFGRARPASISAAAPNTLNVALQYPDGTRLSFPPHIVISDLSVQQVREASVEGLRSPRQVSTVLEGRIFNESMNGERYDLRRGEWLTLEGVEGEIRSMELTGAGIRLDYHGMVTDIAVGSSRNQRSLMPNWLEWFSARHGVKLLWGAFFWLSTTLFGVIKWWKKPD